MRFGEMIHSLRKTKGLTLRQLAAEVDVGFHYLSKVENQKLDFGDYPSDALIHRLAVSLDADVDALLLLAKKVPDGMRNRIFERPEVFSALSRCDDATPTPWLVSRRRKIPRINFDLAPRVGRSNPSSTQHETRYQPRRSQLRMH